MKTSHRTAFRHFARLGLVSFMTCASPAFAYDLWQAYQDAKANDPTYLAAVASYDSIKAQKSQAQSVITPTIRLSGKAERADNSTWTATEQALQKYPASATVSLVQPIIAIDKITAYRQVGLSEQAGKLQLAQAEQELISRVVQAYFSAWLTANAAQIASDQVTAAHKQFQIAEKNFEIGNTTVIDKQEAEAAWQNAIAAQINAQATAENTQAALETVIGRSLDEALAPIAANAQIPSPQPKDLKHWLERAREQNNALKIAQLRHRIAELDVSRTSQTRLPTLNFTASYTWTHKNFRQSNDVRSNSSRLGLELTMPLFDGGLTSAQVAQAEATTTVAYQNLRGAKLAAEQSTRSAYNQATSGLASINALARATNNAQQAMESNRLGYQLGMRINVDVQNAQNIYALTQNNLAQAQYNTIMGHINLKAAVGELSEADVKTINALLKK